MENIKPPLDKLSAIGGAMGLLTGFSLISGVEILYFLIKFIHILLIQKFDKANNMGF